MAYIKESKSTKQLFRNLSFKNNRTNKIKRINFPIKRNNYTSKSSPSSRRLMSTDDDVSEEELEARINVKLDQQNKYNEEMEDLLDTLNLKRF